MRELPDLLDDVKRDREIAAIRERLAQLESEKAELEGSLNKLLAAQEAKDSSPLAGDKIFGRLPDADSREESPISIGDRECVCVSL
jgi:hypothetical protein